MSAWRDVIAARLAADGALSDALFAYDSATTVAGRASDPALAALLAARVIALELRALSTLIDHAWGDS
jgi:hypothetical protein